MATRSRLSDSADVLCVSYLFEFLAGVHRAVSKKPNPSHLGAGHLDKKHLITNEESALVKKLNHEPFPQTPNAA